MPRLRRANCSTPGIVRKRSGRGFVYLHFAGGRIVDPEVLARIKALAIPPAWTDVWICPWPNGHIQAVGTDAKGRKQYRYHDVWRQRRDAEKFEHMIAFGRVLPALREHLHAHLTLEGFPRERTLACAVRLLDLGFFRIGSEGYVEENDSYGLATIHKRHVSLDGQVITFDYMSKSGKQRIHSLADADVYAVVEALKRRRSGGPELLAYQRDGRWCDVKSADINAYIKDATGAEFSAKDFRTWNATVLAAVGLAVSSEVTSATGRKRAVVRAVKEVAQYLGNTPAVARGSYIDPRVIDRFDAGVTVRAALGSLGEGVEFGQLSTQGPVEAAVLDLLDDVSLEEALAS